MKKILVGIIVLLSFTLIKANENKSDDLIGNWEIVKCNLEYNGIEVRTLTAKEVNGKMVAVINGEKNPSDPFYQMMQGISTSKMSFESDGTYNWIVDFEALSVKNGYWKFEGNSKTIKVCEKINKETFRPLVAEFTNVRKEDNYLLLTFGEGGLNFHFKLKKK